MSLCVRKITIWVSDKVRNVHNVGNVHKPDCTFKEAGLRLEILDVRRRGIVLSV